MSVMSTNGSDIISKRNVERVYFPTEPQYARFFVKKLQKRTPLNNRIFYLRMHLIDAAICQFLTRPSQKSKVIVNLGCGSDTLPWRCMFRHARLCLGAKFVDIDSPEVLMPKRDIVKQTPELLSPLTSPEFPENSSILLTSDQYCQIACNLHQLSEIEHALPKFIDVDTSEFLFVAEISMAHIEVGDADALIRWAGAIGDAEFCLLEPTLPDGPSSPFTEAMLQQLAKDKVSSKSVEHYPTINSQQKRFKALGWPNARARSWWHAWSDPLCMSPSQRKVLDTVEDFDDWEEFVYFASHRCVLHAQTAALLTESPSQGSLAEETDMSEIPTTAVDVTFSPPITTKNVSPRRSGAPMVLQTIMGQNVVANIFGHGPDGQLRSCDLYSKSSDPEAASRIVLPRGGPGARSCFTLTDLGDSGYLLAGGKGSHAAPFSDCWIFKKDTHQWVEIHSLPFPLFRHSVERLGNSKLVLLAGGRLDFTAAHSDFLVFHPNIGWMRCSVKGTLQPPAIYGCFLSCTGSMKLIPSAFCGILAGGMTTDGVVFNEALEWVLDVSNITEPTITFKPIASRWPNQLLARYGAVSARAGDWVVVVGGVGTTGTLPASQEIVRFRSYGERSEVYEYLEFVQGFGPEAWRTFSTGASIVAVDNSEIAIIGGGTHCFSTESGWSRGVYSFPIRGSSVSVKSTRERAVWKYSRTLTVTNEAPATPHETNPQRLPSKTTIPRMELKSAEHFESILRSGKPVVFENLELGSCLAKWSLTYLAERVGPERKVVVHESMDQAMDFLAKNFRYKTQTFQEFAGDVDNGKKLYLRALSADKPSGAPSILDVDFPMIASDFILPPQLAFVDDKLFSSVLRISGPVNMWLHYDVLANIYCQIEGIKRFYLFPPTDVTKLGFAPGSSSSSIDVFSALTSSSLPQCNIYEAILKPGDVLFLPQLWLHTATPVSDSSIAVNVFFRDLEKGYSSGRDVYGNRDLAAYEKARQDVSRMSGAFKDLPRDTKQFYLRRLADELLQIATE